MNQLAKIWHDPVWSKVLAGIILLVVAPPVTYVLNWWPAIGEVVQTAYHFALLPTALPNWIIALLGLLTFSTILIRLAALWQAAFPPNQAPTWKNYTTDTFFNLRWRWRYFDDGQLHSLCVFCPHCDLQVNPQQNLIGYRGVDRIGFHCDKCGQSLAEFNESIGSLENKVKRHIQLKLRNQTWRVKDSATS